MRIPVSFSRAASTLSRPLRTPAAHARIRRALPVPSHIKRHIASEGAEPSEHDLRYGFYDVILPEEPFVWGTAHVIPRAVPSEIPRPSYVPHPNNPDALHEKTSTTKRVLITDEDDLCNLRKAAKLAAETLQFAALLAQPGYTTDLIDMGVHEFITRNGGYPSPLLYKGFPKSCCTSVNNILVHGIPDDRELQDGDIVNVDVTVYLNGFHGDTSRTFLVGDVDQKGQELVSITQDALDAGIAACGPGKPFKDIGKAIHNVLRGKDYSASPAFTGHGIGREFHRQPWIHHVLNDEPEIMQPGDCFTIEPAIVQGDNPSAVTYPDGWTASTENCARAAQAEHMVLITETGVDVLTRL